MNGKTVVVADDEPHIRHVLALKLEKGGLEVLTAADGQEAFDLCLAEMPDLLITDYQMPLMSGLELCRQLRENPATAEIPAIMLTARNFDVPEDEVAQLGITSVMTKPFSPAEVFATAMEVLQRPKAVRE